MGDDGAGLIGTAIGLVVLGSVAKSVLGTPRARTRTVYRNRPKRRKSRRYIKNSRNLFGLK